MIKENLEKILAAKQSIKQSLIDKKAITEDTAFAEYADAIQNIPSVLEVCESGLGEFATTTLADAKKIHYGVFARGSKVTDATFPACSVIESNAFYSCSNLLNADFPTCTTLSSNAFAYCTKLKTVSFPEATVIGSSAFYYCTKLTGVTFPKAKTIYNDAFFDCFSITNAIFPECTYIYSMAFIACYSLTDVYLPKCSYIGQSTFYSCRNLVSLYMLSNSVASLYNSSTLKYSPIDGYTNYTGMYGSIYVPASLYTKYKSSTNWVYFSNRFVSMTDSEIETLKQEMEV